MGLSAKGGFSNRAKIEKCILEKPLPLPLSLPLTLCIFTGLHSCSTGLHRASPNATAIPWGRGRGRRIKRGRERVIETQRGGSRWWLVVAIVIVIVTVLVIVKEKGKWKIVHGKVGASSYKNAH